MQLGLYDHKDQFIRMGVAGICFLCVGGPFFKELEDPE